MLESLSGELQARALSFLAARDDPPPPRIERPNFYGYDPTLWICIMFIVLFSITTIVHFVQGFVHKTWYIYPTIILCGLLEILGWVGRTWNNRNPHNDDAFTIQITCTIIGPTPLLASNFVMIGRIINMLGTQYSRIGPRMYTILFLSCDILSLVLQGLGGGWASAAAQNGRDLMPGTNLMLGGIAFQAVVIVIFSTITLEFIWRYFMSKPARAVGGNRGVLTKSTKIMLIAIALNTICLGIRAVYRIIELADGWNGTVMETQWLFNFFDGAMVVIAMYLYNFIHPGMFIKESDAFVPKKAVEDVQMDSYSNRSNRS